MYIKYTDIIKDWLRSVGILRHVGVHGILTHSRDFCWHKLGNSERVRVDYLSCFKPVTCVAKNTKTLKLEAKVWNMKQWVLLTVLMQLKVMLFAGVTFKTYTWYILANFQQNRKLLMFHLQIEQCVKYMVIQRIPTIFSSLVLTALAGSIWVQSILLHFALQVH